jgi:hypothetical protein
MWFFVAYWILGVFLVKDYFCVSSGELSDEMIKNYLEYHFELKGDRAEI